MGTYQTKFSDAEILSYGINSGFFLNESTCLLKEASDSSENALIRAVKSFPAFKTTADYVAGSFMNPKKTIKVFSKVGKELLSFYAALPFSSDKEVPLALIIKKGNEGYLSAEPQKTVNEMLYELSGYNSDSEQQPLRQEASPMEIIILLSACDVILQDRYDKGFFTAAALMNAFDPDSIKSSSGVCSPIAYLCGDYILKRFSDEDLSAALKAMCDAEVLKSDRLDGVTLYSFANDYKHIPLLFSSTAKSLSIFRYLNTGKADIIHIVSTSSDTWVFSIIDGCGIIEKPDKKRIEEILNF